MDCQVPPAGWKCSRKPGHDGPCAARPTRIYDDASHPRYGPVRRCWVILVGLFENADLLDDAYYKEWGLSWDSDLASYLDAGAGERLAMRQVVWSALYAIEAAA